MAVSTDEGRDPLRVNSKMNEVIKKEVKVICAANLFLA